MTKTRTSGKNLNSLNLSEDGTNIVSAITLQLDEIRSEMKDMRKEFSDCLARKTSEINELKIEMNIYKNRMIKVEEILGSAETKLRQNNAVFSGDDIPIGGTGENCTQIIRDVLANKIKLVVPTADIEAAYRVGKTKPNTNGQPGRATPILVKFKNPDIKRNIFETCKIVKPKFFVNDDLSPIKQTILYVLRQAKKKHPAIVSGCSSLDGNIYTWIKPQNPSEGSNNRRMMVNTLEKLKSFCSNTVKSGLETFIQTWPH